jgi:hypothetical protein
MFKVLGRIAEKSLFGEFSLSSLISLVCEPTIKGLQNVHPWTMESGIGGFQV